jgi:hypothetical protein
VRRSILIILIGALAIGGGITSGAASTGASDRSSVCGGLAKTCPPNFPARETASVGGASTLDAHDRAIFRQYVQFWITARQKFDQSDLIKASHDEASAVKWLTGKLARCPETAARVRQRAIDLDLFKALYFSIRLEGLRQLIGILSEYGVVIHSMKTPHHPVFREFQRRQLRGFALVESIENRAITGPTDWCGLARLTAANPRADDAKLAAKLGLNYVVALEVQSSDLSKRIDAALPSVELRTRFKAVLLRSGFTQAEIKDALNLK